MVLYEYEHRKNKNIISEALHFLISRDNDINFSGQQDNKSSTERKLSL